MGPKQLLKFSASWCQPCKALAGNFKYVDMKDVELKEYDIEKDFEMSNTYSIRSVPTMVLLEDGKEVKRTSGVLMADKIEEFIHG
jgi:thioredoxin-like negative regulator of GroEL